jgi:hypothetical protein
MAKRKVGSQIGSLTPNHKKLEIDLISLRASGVQHAVGKLAMRATTLFQTSFQSKVYTRSYNPAKLHEFQPWQFQNPRTKNHFLSSQRGVEYTIWGKVVTSPKFGPWWVLWIQGRPWLVLALQQCINQLVGWFCAGLCEWIVCLSLFLVPSRSSSTLLYPP